MNIQIRVTSYNIRKAVGLDWKRDSNRIMRVLDEINADIVILQEADKRLGARHGVFDTHHLQDNFGYKIASMSMNEVSHGWHGNAILFKDSFTEITHDKIWLPQKEPRGAVSVTLAHTSGVEMECVGAHLALTQATRLKQISTLRRYLDDKPVKRPRLIAGDFNTWRQNASLQQAFGDDYLVTSPGASFHTSLPKLSLDYFVTSRDILIKNTAVYYSDLSRKASDHLPIYADVELKSCKP